MAPVSAEGFGRHIVSAKKPPKPKTKGENRMSYTYGVVHATVHCEDCGWESSSYKNAQATAKIHAKRYGHKVIGELGISFSYDYRGEGVNKNEP